LSSSALCNFFYHQNCAGVESAEPDLKNSIVSVKGVYDPEKLVEYVYKRTGKHTVIVKKKQEPEKEAKVEEAKVAEAKEEKKKEEEIVTEKKSGEGEENKEKKEEEAKGETKTEETAAAASSEDSNNVVPEVKIIEYFYNSPRYGMEVYAYPTHPVQPAYPAYFHAYPPQIFSDENPNACTVM